MKKFKALFILSGNISTTPRALKSILYFKDFFDIDIVAINRSDLWLKMDNDLCSPYNLNYHVIDLANDTSFSWLVKSINYKFYSLIGKIFRYNIKIKAFADSKASLFLTTYLRKHKRKYEFISGNSFGSLFPAFYLSKKLNIPFIFDVEDYHPGENASLQEQNNRAFLMKTILPHAKFITYASPLIGEYTKKLIPEYPGHKMILINNCFSQTEFQFIDNNNEKVKFVWFSQNIAHGRGLELVLPVLEKYKDKIELHLIGNLYDDFYNNFLSKYSDFIVIHKPLPQKDLNLKLCEFDIGLAIELKNADFNRQICLTNKIFAYTQAGLYILATDTQAQKLFLQQNCNVGEICKQNIESVENSVNEIVNNIQQIRKNKQQRFEYATQLSWETESQKLTEIWNKI